MSEYIVSTINMPEHVMDAAVAAWTKEEIVRCRDCSKWRFFDVDGGVRFGTCGEWERADSYCKPATREDGFCAWGERRGA